MANSDLPGLCGSRTATLLVGPADKAGVEVAVVNSGIANRGGTSEEWAAKLRRNMLAHRVLPKSQYFLIVTPERIYGWIEETLPASDALPQFTIDSQEVLGPYFSKFGQNPAEISPVGFELLVHTWLIDISRSAGSSAENDPSLRLLAESGLLASLKKADIQMNSAR